MATVYLAQDLKHHRKVAIKVLRPEIAAALGAERRGDLGPEDLDGDFAMVLQVLGEVDGCHPAAPQLALERVAVGQGSAEGVERQTQGRRSALSRFSAARASATYGCSSGSACHHTSATKRYAGISWS